MTTNGVIPAAPLILWKRWPRCKKATKNFVGANEKWQKRPLLILMYGARRF
jgi:hypothetical protein